MKERENMFHLPYDSVKWLFSKYESGKYKEDIFKLLMSILDTVCKMGYDVISDSSLHREKRQQFIDLAKRYGYEVIEINLEADYEILAKRFDERLESSRLNPQRRIANTSKDRFKELHDLFQKEKNPSAIIFRCDNQNPEEISEQIMKLLQ
jgi:predicted kinase